MPEAGAVSALAFDFGLRRIGVAVGQSITGSANPLAIVNARDGAPDWPALDRLIKEWKPDLLVVGLPYTMSGSEQQIYGRVLGFVRDLQQRYPHPVHTVDERLSSHAAQSQLKQLRQQGRRRIRRGEIDCAAACVILESWFHSQDNHATRKPA
jgi:putative pre-16S rRNA nuclease